MYGDGVTAASPASCECEVPVTALSYVGCAPVVDHVLRLQTVARITPTSLLSHKNRPNALVANLTTAIDGISSRPIRYGGPSDVYTGVWYREGMNVLKVAIKVVRTSDTAHDSILKRLKREISVWHKLDHPHLLPLYGLHWELGGLPAMVSPWHEHGDIMSYLRLSRAESHLDELKLHLLEQVLEGLKFLHNSTPPIVHGDIKGSNVLVTDEGNAQLADFGLATMLAEASTMSSGSFIVSTQSVIKGTCRWMAPELFDDDEQRHTLMSDIWACGCLFAEVFTGQVPYPEKKHDLLVILALSRREVSPRPMNTRDEHWLLVSECCNPDANRRPSIEAVIDLLVLISFYTHTLRFRRAAELYRDTKKAVDAILSTVQRRTSPLQNLRSLERKVLPDLMRLLPNAEAIPVAQKALLGLFLSCSSAVGSEYADLRETASSAVIALGIVGTKDLPLDRFEPERILPIIHLLATTHSQTDSEIEISISSLLASYVEPTYLFRGQVTSVSLLLGPVATRVALGMLDGSIRIWDASTGRTIVGPIRSHRNRVSTLTASHDGAMLASSSWDKTLRIWLTATGNAIGVPYHSASSWIRSHCFSRDNDSIACGFSDGTFGIWDFKNGVWLTSVNFCSSPTAILSTTITPDGRRFFFGSTDYVFEVQDGHSVRLIRTFGERNGNDAWKSVTAVAFSPDCTRLASVSKRGISVWNLEEGCLLISSTALDDLTAVAFSHDGAKLAVGSADGIIWIVGARTCERLKRPLKGHTNLVWSLAFSQNQRYIASASIDGTVRLWNCDLLPPSAF